MGPIDFQMDVTLIICTWNRAESLRNCLLSLKNLLVPEGISWEVLVVINGSSDHTAGVVADFQQVLPIRSVDEPMQGLSRARNTGVKNALGRLIIFFDDDVCVDSFCLTSFLQAKALNPKGALFGGVIEPQFEIENLELAALLKEPFFDGLLLRKNLGSEMKVMNSDEYFFGANFAVERVLFDLVQFDVNLGKKGKQQLLGEEIRLQDEAIQRGLPRVWVPSAKVTHGIDTERLSLKYLCLYFWGLGRTHYRLKNTIFFPRVRPFTLIVLWTQLIFFGGCLYEFFSSHFSFLIGAKHS